MRALSCLENDICMQRRRESSNVVSLCVSRNGWLPLMLAYAPNAHTRLVGNGKPLFGVRRSYSQDLIQTLCLVHDAFLYQSRVFPVQLSCKQRRRYTLVVQTMSPRQCHLYPLNLPKRDSHFPPFSSPQTNIQPAKDTTNIVLGRRKINTSL